MHCEHCGQKTEPTLSLEEYEARAIPRLAKIDMLAGKIDFENPGWENTSGGKLYNHLIDLQNNDEVAAGL